MKILRFTLITLIAIACLNSCNFQPTGSHAKLIDINGQKLIDCNISEVTDTINLKLSELVKNCELIPLETNDSSLYKRAWHIGISDNYLAIHSRGQMPIKLFNRQGKFIRNIGKVGRGPGEFGTLYDIQLDETANKLYLLPFARANKIIVYSLDNEILPAIPLAYQQTKFKAHVDNGTLTVLSMPFKVKDQRTIPLAYQQTLDGKIIQEYRGSEHLLINPINADGQFVGFNNEISSSFNTNSFDVFTLKFGGKQYDTLYHYNPKLNELHPRYVATFNEEKQPYWSYELKNHFYTIIFGDKYKGSKVIVDKKTLKSDFFKIENDFWGGLEMKSFYMSNNGYFVCSMLAVDLKTEFENILAGGDIDPKTKNKIEKLQKQIDENDNEILFIGEMI